MCDNIDDTLILIRTEFGKTIGGYTHLKWNQTDGWVHDEEKRAFLLQLDNHEKLTPVKDYNIIHCSSEFGPIFGDGNDIHIVNFCH